MEVWPDEGIHPGVICKRIKVGLALESAGILRSTVRPSFCVSSIQRLQKAPREPLKLMSL